MLALDAFLKRWETLEEALSLESYNQYAGLAYDEAHMTRLAEEMQSLATEGLREWRRGDVPDSLFFALVANASAREMTLLQNELFKLRNDAVTATWQGETINLNNVRRFNFDHAREAPARERVFRDLMTAASRLTPTLKERFRLSRDAHAAYGVTPLDVYEIDERVSRRRLVELVEVAARKAKPAFAKLASEFSEEVLGKPRMEDFDDMYVYRATVYGPVEAEFSKVDYLKTLRKTAEAMGFHVDAIAIDGEPREGKFSSPVCFGVKIPGDVRVLYQRTSPFGDYESFYHEMGHAFHFASVEGSRPYWDRRLIPNGVAEIFSTLFEELAMDPSYLAEDVGLPASVIEDVVRRRRFMELFFLTFYGANSMHKVRFWSENLTDDFEEADRAYSDLTERMMGVRVPGVYWQTHHVLSMNDVYAPSYLLANVRKSELIRALTREFGERWWRSREAGAWLRERAMGPGAAIDLDAFSKLDEDAYLSGIVRP